MLHDWEEFINGDNESLGRLYRPVFRPLLMIAMHFIKDREKAHDIVQEIFLKIVDTTPRERQEKWKDIRDIEAYLAVMVRCKCLETIKTETNRSRLLSENFHPETHTNFDFYFEKTHLDTCIDKLPLKEQALLRMHLEGYKNHEIAEIHTLSEKTVKNRLSMTRSKLAGLWKNLIIIALWGMK